ncbi:hypothetical protein [Seonamhaeicola sp.]|uniref:hypothetical protein n=1 Tax=Seonamhaeicola sp. TaxID=1912245 RepID=UPI0026243F87|nr:hypothetical protein [Seonamhaeicola sp.]
MKSFEPITAIIIACMLYVLFEMHFKGFKTRKKKKNNYYIKYLKGYYQAYRKSAGKPKVF